MRLIILIFFFFSTALSAQQSFNISKQLQWAATPILHNPTGQQAHTIWSFEGALYGTNNATLPIFMERFPLSQQGKLRVSIKNVTYEPLLGKIDKEETVATDLQIHTTVEQDRNQYYGKVFFTPIIKEGSTYKKVTSIDLQVTLIPTTQKSQSRNSNNIFNSILREGEIYKIAVSETGIHQLTYDFLREELNIDIDQINPENIHLFGNGGGMLPEAIRTERIDDLKENEVYVGEYRADRVYISPEGYIKMYLLELEESNRHNCYYKVLTEKSALQDYILAP